MYYLKKISKSLFPFLDIIFFFFFIVIKSIAFNSTLEKNYLAFKGLIPSLLCCIVILIAISLLFSHRKRLRFLYICNIVITSLMVADLVYFSYFKDLISIFTLRNIFLLGDVKSSVDNLFNYSYLLFYVDIVLLLPLKKLYKNKNITEIKRKHKFAIFSLITILAVLLDSRYIYNLSVQQPKLLTSMYNKVYIAKSIGDINYHIIDGYNFVTNSLSKAIPLSQKDSDTISAFLNSNKSSTNNYKGQYKGKNLIIIQVEALQNFAINATFEGQELTPNLNAFLKRSCYFNNYFYQVSSGGTSDAEFMSNNSLYPAASGTAYFLYSGNKFNSIGSELKKQGYTTAALHGFRESFWNRQVMYKALEFDKFYGEKTYNINEQVGLGISDKSFLAQSVKKIEKEKQPFYSFIITLSSHFPFDDTKHYGTFNSGKYEGTLLGNYMKAIHYTDAQLGMFLNSLEKDNIMKNSVIAIYGDHNAITKSSESQLMEFMNLPDNDLNWNLAQKVPLIIHVPDEKIKGVNKTFGGEMDLYPTLSNLMNINNKYEFGKDLLNSTTGKVIFRNGSFTDGKVYYTAITDRYYDISSGKVLPKSKSLIDYKNQCINQLQYSDEILNHNLLKK